jgi:drug/metabolite transporter (DMT)-like permease
VIAAYPIAVLAAGSNATSNVLQRKANRGEPPDLSMRPRLLLDLLHRRVWLAGFGTVVLSFVLMAVALSMGRLAAVQPIVVLELPLTLVGAAKVLHARLGRREWTAVAVMTCGLAGLIVFLAPSGGNGGRPPGFEWLVASVATATVVGGCVAASLVDAGSRLRPVLLGVATGITFGLTAAYMKGMTAALDHGVLSILTTWKTSAMAITGIAGMFLMQNALHSGRLVAAQPGITLADPAVAILWGIVVFGEQPRGGLFLVLAFVSACALATGALVLARSPLLERERQREPEPSSRSQ